MSDNESDRTGVKMDTIGNSLSFVLVAIGLLVLLFHGDPDIAESLRVAAQKWAASKEAQP